MIFRSHNPGCTQSAFFFIIDKLIQLGEKLSDKSSLFLKSEISALNSMERNVNNMNPENVLKRGYSITLLNGKTVTTADEVKEGSIIETVVIDGVITSIVRSSNKTDEL